MQNVKDFELVVNSFRATHDTSIFITGSNSKLLSGELASHLGGRTLSFTVLPFRFKEFCESKQSHDYDRLLREYITWGGFPLVCNETAPENKRMILSSLYDSIVLKDIVQRNRIASPIALDKVLDYLIANSSLTVSGNRIANILKGEKIGISAPTVYEYIRYVEEACVIHKVERYDISGHKLLQYEEKIYVPDLGLFALKKSRTKDEFNLIVETLVFNELIARGYQVYIGKTYRGEVDFIAERNGVRVYIQAVYLMETEETRRREFGAYQAVGDHYAKYVISMDPITADQDGIRHLRLMDFLIDDDSVRP
ncbi:MAG: ATP-binding protein [Lachnospiraceae bacterium]|nr:ATP-binding protein [Lachnospiraceae bacterium]